MAAKMICYNTYIYNRKKKKKIPVDKMELSIFWQKNAAKKQKFLLKKNILCFYFPTRWIKHFYACEMGCYTSFTLLTLKRSGQKENRKYKKLTSLQFKLVQLIEV